MGWRKRGGGHLKTLVTGDRGRRVRRGRRCLIFRIRAAAGNEDDEEDEEKEDDKEHNDDEEEDKEDDEEGLFSV